MSGGSRDINYNRPLVPHSLNLAYQQKWSPLDKYILEFDILAEYIRVMVFAKTGHGGVKLHILGKIWGCYEIQNMLKKTL